MKYLLDVNVLPAAVWANHPHYPAADAWLNYLAALAHRHGCKLATLDGGLKHPAVERIQPTEPGGREAASPRRSRREPTVQSAVPTAG